MKEEESAVSPETPADGPPNTDKPETVPSLVPWMSIGAAFFAVGAAGVIGLGVLVIQGPTPWYNRWVLFGLALALVLTGIGGTAIVAPFVGIDLPQPSL